MSKNRIKKKHMDQTTHVGPKCTVELKSQTLGRAPQLWWNPLRCIEETDSINDLAPSPVIACAPSRATPPPSPPPSRFRKPFISSWPPTPTFRRIHTNITDNINTTIYTKITNKSKTSLNNTTNNNIQPTLCPPLQPIGIRASTSTFNLSSSFSS